MKNITPEMISKAREAKTKEDLKTMAEQEGMIMDLHDAAQLFDKLHPSDEEISDDELESVAGGGCGQENPCKSFMSDGCSKFWNS